MNPEVASAIQALEDRIALASEAISSLRAEFQAVTLLAQDLDARIARLRPPRDPQPLPPPYDDTAIQERLLALGHRIDAETSKLLSALDGRISDLDRRLTRYIDIERLEITRAQVLRIMGEASNA